MKTKLSILMFLLIPMLTFSQIDVSWDETYGGSENDAANSLIQLSDGNLLVVGYTMSEGSGGKDGWAAKINTKGELIWEMTYGGPKDDILYDAVEMSNGNLSFAGSTESQGAGKTDCWYIMADNEGTQKWDKTYGGDKDDEATSITLSIDGKIILTGYTKSRGAGNRDIWLIKIDQDATGKDQGKEIWKRNAGGDKADFPGHVIQNQTDSAIIVVGTTNSYGNGSGDMYLIRVLNDRGQIKGKKFLGRQQYEFGNGFAFTDEGGYFMVGATMSESNGLFDGYVLRINNEFDLYFEKNIGGAKDDYFMGVVPSNDNFLIVGYTNSEGEGNSDAWLLLMDINGNIIKEIYVGDSGMDKFVKIIKIDDKSFYVCGSTSSKGSGKEDVWVAKITISK